MSNNTIPLTQPLYLYIEDLVSDGATDFYGLDDAAQDTLIGLVMQAYDNDIDIVLSREANELLAKYLLSQDPDDAIELRYAVKDSAREHFSTDLDYLIASHADARRHNPEGDLLPFIDRETGEQLWI